MMRAMKPPLHLLVCLVATAVALPAAAQGSTKSLGTAKGVGKLLTRDELRACLSQQKELGTRRQALEAEYAALDRERAELDERAKSLEAEREAIDKLAQEAADANRRMQQMSQQIADYNERVAKFEKSSLSGMSADRQRQSLEREKATLDKAATTLQAERNDIVGRAETLGKAFNARAASRNQAAGDWNERNAQQRRSTQAFEVDLATWKADCEGRSYRDEDEKAILSGR